MGLPVKYVLDNVLERHRLVSFLPQVEEFQNLIFKQLVPEFLPLVARPIVIEVAFEI